MASMNCNVPFFICSYINLITNVYTLSEMHDHINHFTVCECDNKQKHHSLRQKIVFLFSEISQLVLELLDISSAETDTT